MRFLDLLLLASIACVINAFVKDKRCDTHNGRCVSAQAARKYCKQRLRYICPGRKVCCHKMMWDKNNNNGNGAGRKCGQTKTCANRNGTCVPKKSNTCQTETNDELCLGRRCTCCLGGTDKPVKRLKKCRCGQANEARTIEEVPPPNKYPWIVGIVNQNIYNDSVSCSGAIIADRYVITAAHCLMESSSSGNIANSEDIKIRILSQHDLNSTYEASVKRLVVHEDYRHENRSNDLALVQLKTPLKWATDGAVRPVRPLKSATYGAVRPVCLPADDDKTQGSNILVGWGARNESTFSLDPSEESNVTIVSFCNGNHLTGTKNTDNIICGIQGDGDEDPCYGDSGSPLAVKKGLTHTIVGVVSFDIGCGMLKTPVVYTSVGNYLQWIVENTSLGKYCSVP
ncbi:mite allergen Der p 3-like isoform X3 [Palaemon carinicauda]|uniref:mite allergen Der p 3-like isoform X3 n=1 Tax=Palaemon carinicauda TaxID=392227 RepID=UPI0035B5B23A